MLSNLAQTGHARECIVACPAATRGCNSSRNRAFQAARGAGRRLRLAMPHVAAYSECKDTYPHSKKEDPP